MATARKPIGVAAMEEPNCVIVVCDDGTVWRSMGAAIGEWEQRPSIPDSPADRGPLKPRFSTTDG